MALLSRILVKTEVCTYNVLKPNWNIGQLLNLNTFSRTFKSKKVTFVLLILLLGTSFATLLNTTEAAPNEQINYQGKLTDNLGSPVTDGTYNVRFFLYTQATGGSNIWTETASTTVTSGLFSHMLGTTTSLSGIDFNQTLYLGVEVGGTGSPSWDGEMTPRKILGTVPAAFEARQLDGLGTSSFLRADQADTANNLITFAGGASTTDIVISDTATTTNIVVNSNVTLVAHTDGLLVTNNAGVVSASTSLSDSFIDDNLTLGTGATFANDIVTPNSVQSSGQNDEYCLTYETTGTTWEWQDCAGSIANDSLDWTEFTDTMTLDATTTIAMAHALNFDSGLLYIDGQNDEVGIGTSNPVTLLDVAGPVRFQGNVFLGDTFSGATPTITESNDTDIDFGNNGSSDVRIETDTGRVGIGTTSPASLLDVYGDFRVGTSGTPSLFVDVSTGRVGIGDTSPQSPLTVDTSSGNAGLFKTNESVDSIEDVISLWRLRDDATDPGAGFGAALSFDLEVWFDNIVSQAGAINVFWENEQTAFGDGNSSMSFDLLRNGNTSFTAAILNSLGNLGVGTTSPWAKLSVVSNASSTGPLFVVASSSDGISTTTNFIIDENGRVGIGTANPDNLYVLDVAGDMIIDRNIVMALEGGSKNVGALNSSRVIFSNTSSLGTRIMDTTGEVARFAEGKVAIGTGTASALLTIGSSTQDAIPAGDLYNSVYIAGALELDGALYDASNSAGTAGYVLQSTGTSTEWVATSSLGIGGGSSVSFGTDNQIPFTNSGGTDFDYDSDFTFDGTKLSIGPEDATYADYVSISNNSGATFGTKTLFTVANVETSTSLHSGFFPYAAGLSHMAVEVSGTGDADTEYFGHSAIGWNRSSFDVGIVGGVNAAGINNSGFHTEALYGVNSVARNFAGTASTSYGVYAESQNSSGNQMDDAYGVYATSFLNDLSTTTNSTGLFANSYVATSGLLTNSYGVQIGSNYVGGAAASAITNAYGLYIADQSNAQNSYSLYVADATSSAYFAGNVGIGTTSPQALLTTSASGLSQTWSQVGTSTSISAVSFGKITALSPNRIVHINATDEDLEVYEFNGTSWSQVGTDFNISGAGIPGLTALSPNRIAYVDSSDDNLRVYEFDGSTWSQVGIDYNISAGVAHHNLTTLSSNRVALGNGNDSNIYSFEFDGTNWNEVGTAFSIGAGLDVDTNVTTLSPNRIAHISASHSSLQVYEFDGNTWSSVGNGLTITSTGDLSITALAPNRVAYLDNDIDELRVYEFDGTNWNEIGTGLDLTGLAGTSEVIALTPSRVAFYDVGNDELRTYQFAAPLLAAVDSNDMPLFSVSDTGVVTIAGPVATTTSGAINFGSQRWLTFTNGYETNGDNTNSLQAAFNTESIFLDRVGIGTSSPDAKLTVAGEINIDAKDAGLSILGNRVFYASSTAFTVVAGVNAGAALQSAALYNVAIGDQALQNAATTTHNVAVGFEALQDFTGVDGSGSATAIGEGALANAVTGFRNTALGRRALYFYTGGNDNVALGGSAGENLTGGEQNVLIGSFAGNAASNYNTSRNIFIGHSAGSNVQSSATNNILLGYDIDLPSSTGSNQLSIGNLIYGTGIDGQGTTTSSGNIGIGTSTPGYKLTIAGDIMIAGGLYDNNYDPGTNGFILQSTGSGIDWVATSTLGLGAGSIADDSLDWAQFTDTMTLDATTTIAMAHALNFDSGTLYIDGQNDRVGIGTTSPGLLLELVSTADAQLRVSGRNTVGVATTDPNSGSIIIGGGISPTIAAGIGYDATSRDLYIENLDNSGSDRDIVLRSNGSELLRLKGEGNVGIGTSSPASLLDVYGDFRVGTSGVPLLFADTSANRVGIGTTSLDTTFEVDGDVLFTAATDNYFRLFDSTYFGGNGSIDPDVVSNSVGALFKSSKTYTSGIDDDWSGAFFAYDIDNTGVSTAQQIYGHRVQLDYANALTGSEQLVGDFKDMSITGSGSMGSIYGDLITLNFTGPDFSAVYGDFNQIIVESSSEGNVVYGANNIAWLQDTASTSFAVGQLGQANASDSSYIKSAYGLYGHVFKAAGATIDNAYGLYLTDIASNSTTTAQYGIYQSGTNDYNLLFGNTAIGHDAATSTAILALFATSTNDILNLFETGGSEVFTVLESGNVGVGTTSPASLLDVYGDFRVGTSGTPTLFVDASTDRVGIGTTSLSSLLHISSSGLGSATGNSLTITSGLCNQVNIASEVTSSGLQLTGGDNCGGGSYHGDGDGTAASIVNLLDGPLFFGTDNQQNMVIDNTGYLGIGTSSPNTLLTVGSSTPNALTAGEQYNSVFIAGSLELDGAFYDSSNSAGTNGYVMQTTGSGVQWVSTSSLNISSVGSSNLGDLSDVNASAQTDGSILSYDGTNWYATTSLYVSSSTGYVGIGTANPAEKLHVDGSALIQTMTVTGNSLRTTSNAIFMEIDSNGNESGGYFAIEDSGTELMRIVDSGNVGIGTTSPASLLDVYGDFRVGTSATSTLFVDTSTNRVGVGTTNPGALFEAAGRILSSQNTPVKVGGTSTDAAASDIFVRGDYAYITSESTGDDLEIFNISDPTNPVEVGSVATGNGATAVQVAGDYAYITSSSVEDLEIFDISDPTNPVKVGGVGTADGANDVKVSGHYAYVVSQDVNDDLEAFDISDPTNPVKVGGVSTIADVNDLLIRGNYAYLGLDFQAGDEIEIFDISDPTNMVKVGGAAGPQNVRGMALSGHHLYTVGSSATNEFRIFDVSDPTNPTEVGAADTGGTAFEVTVSGDYAYVAASIGFQVFDISSSTNPFQIASAALGDTGRSLAISGNYAYVTSNTTGDDIEVFDLGGIQSPTGEIGSLLANRIDTEELLAETANFSTGLNVGQNAQINGLLSITGTASTSLLSSNTNPALIVQSGYVGVGTTTPGYDLTVDGSTMLAGALYDNNYSAGTNGYILQSTGSGVNWVATSTLGLGAGSIADDSLDWAQFTDTMTLDATTTIAMDHALNFDSGTLYIDGQNDRIGIGTSSPAYMLDIYGDNGTGQTQIVMTNPDTSTNGFTGIVMQENLLAGQGGRLNYLNSGRNSNGVNDPNQMAIYTLGGATGGIAMYTLADAPIVFATDGFSRSDEHLRINGDGKIGIGTTSPWARLSVVQHSGETGPLFVVASSSAGTATSTEFIIDEFGNIGIGTANPSRMLDLEGTGTAGPNFRIGRDGFNHGMSSYEDVDTQWLFSSWTGANSGANAYGFSNAGDTAGITLQGVVGASSPNAGTAAVEIIGLKQFGTTIQGLGDDDTLFEVSNFSQTRERLSLLADGRLGIHDSSPDFGLEVVSSSTNGYFAVSSRAANDGDVFVVDASGNVGIGTSSPASALHVANGLTMLKGESTFNDLDYSGDFTHQLYIGNSSDDNTVTNNQGILLGTGGFGNNPMIRMRASGGSLGYLGWNNSETDFFLNVVNNSRPFHIKTDGNERLTVLSSGNIGIGTTSPNALLTVGSSTPGAIPAGEQYNSVFIAGSLELDGALYDSANSAGTNGYVLQTTGSGVTWVATSSLGIGGGGASVLNDLSDVDTSAQADGSILSFDGSNWYATTSLLVSSSTGHVRIGSGSTPRGIFDVNTNSSNIYLDSDTGTISLGDVGGEGAANVLTINNSATSEINLGSTDAVNFRIRNATNDDVQFGDLAFNFGGVYFDLDAGNDLVQFGDLDDNSNSTKLILDDANQRVTIPSGNVGIGVAAPDTILSVAGAPAGAYNALSLALANSTVTSGNQFANYAGMTAAPTSASTGRFVGSYSIGYSNTGNTSGATIVGQQVEAQLGASGDASDLISAQFDITGLSGSSATDAYSVLIPSHNAAAGAITSGAGLAIESINDATNNTHLLLGTSSIPTGDFALYSVATTSSYFAGNVGIGTTTPLTEFTIETAFDGTTGNNVVTMYDSSGTLRSALRDNGTQLWEIGTVGSIAYSTPNSLPGIFIEHGGFNVRMASYNGGLNVSTENDRGIGLHPPTNLLQTPSGALHVWGKTTSLPVLVLEGTSGQTADLQQWWDESDNVLSVVTASGSFGIGTTSPTALLTVGSSTPGAIPAGEQYNSAFIAGSLELDGALYDGSDSAGTSGMVLQTNGASTQWVSTSSLNIGGTDTNSNVATYIVAATSSVNASDADYIADGTNDEATIQAAIDALPVTGGVVYLLEGYYGIEGQIDIDREGVVLQGSGPGTVLRVAAGTNSTFDVIDHLSGSGSSVIRDLTIDGNKAGQSSGTMYGIRYSVDGATSTIHNVTIKNMRDDSIYVDASYDNVTIDSVTISNNNDNGDYGIYVDGSNVTGLTISNSRFSYVDDGVNINTSTGEQIKIVDNHFIEPSSNGVTINFGQYILIANNTFDGNDVNSGSMIGVTANASDVSVLDNVINGSNRDGIGISAERVTVSGNTIHNTGNGTLADAIDIGSSARYVVVSDNLISTTTAADGIAVDGDYVTVTGNLIENTDVNGIGVSGSENVVIANNIIKNTGTRGIYVSFTDNFTINDNMLIDIGANGIELDDGISGTVSGNTIDEVGPGDAGIDIDEANDIVVSGNSISDAGGSVEGIEISNDSYRIHLDGNVITGTWTYLIDDNSSATTYLQNNRGNITADPNDFDGGAYTAFSITQLGTGNLLDLIDADGSSTSTVLTVLDGGNTGIGTSTDLNARLTVQSTTTNDILNLFETSGSEVFTVLESGNVGIGTTSPYADLSVAGDVAITGGIYDNSASLGTNGYVLQSTGSGVNWVATSSLGLGGGGSGPAFGSDNQIPFTNSGGTDFDYSSSFVFDGASLGIGSSTPGGYGSELTIQDTDRARIILAATGASPDVVSFIDSRGDGNNRMQIGTVSDHGIMFFTGGNTFMHLDHTNDGLYVGGGDSAAGHLHVAADDAGDELVIGDNIYTSDDAAVRLNMGNSDESSFIRAGQSSSRYLSVGWVYNATAADAYGNISTANTSNHLALQSTGGNVGIGTTSPGYNLTVDGNAFINDLLQVGSYSKNNQLLIAGQNNDTNSSRLDFSEDAGSNNGIGFVYDSSNNYLNIQDTSADTNRWRFYRDSGSFQLLNGNLLVDGTGDSRIMGNLGVGTSSPASELDVWGDFRVGTSGVPALFVDVSTERVGIGTTSPTSLLHVHGDAANISLSHQTNTSFSGYALYEGNTLLATLTGVGSNFATAARRNDLEIDARNAGDVVIQSLGTGNVGVNVTDPEKMFEVFETVSDDQFRISYDATRYADFQVDSVGDLIIDAQGGDIRMNDENLWVCAGGSCPSGTPSGQGNLIVENRLGVGTSTPREEVEIWNDLYVANGGATGLGQATSTFQGDVLILGKLDVGTIDPIYTIGGTKYATYGASTIGIKEEATATLVLDTLNEETGYYEHTIAWSELPEASDLWLFYQITKFGDNWEELVVSLTPAFDGQVFYIEDIEANALTIQSSLPGKVSARFSASRFDADEWGNVRPDQDDPTTHFTLPVKE